MDQPAQIPQLAVDYSSLRKRSRCADHGVRSVSAGRAYESPCTIAPQKRCTREYAPAPGNDCKVNSDSAGERANSTPEKVQAASNPFAPSHGYRAPATPERVGAPEDELAELKQGIKDVFQQCVVAHRPDLVVMMLRKLAAVQSDSGDRTCTSEGMLCASVLRSNASNAMNGSHTGDMYRLLWESLHTVVENVGTRGDGDTAARPAGSPTYNFFTSFFTTNTFVQRVREESGGLKDEVESALTEGNWTKAISVALFCVLWCFRTSSNVYSKEVREVLIATCDLYRKTERVTGTESGEPIAPFVLTAAKQFAVEGDVCTMLAIIAWFCSATCCRRLPIENIAEDFGSLRRVIRGEQPVSTDGATNGALYVSIAGMMPAASRVTTCCTEDNVRRIRTRIQAAARAKSIPSNLEDAIRSMSRSWLINTPFFPQEPGHSTQIDDAEEVHGESPVAKRLRRREPRVSTATSVGGIHHASAGAAHEPAFGSAPPVLCPPMASLIVANRGDSLRYFLRNVIQRTDLPPAIGGAPVFMEHPVNATHTIVESNDTTLHNHVLVRDPVTDVQAARIQAVVQMQSHFGLPVTTNVRTIWSGSQDTAQRGLYYVVSDPPFPVHERISWKRNPRGGYKCPSFDHWSPPVDAVVSLCHMSVNDLQQCMKLFMWRAMCVVLNPRQPTQYLVCDERGEFKDLLPTAIGTDENRNIGRCESVKGLLHLSDAPREVMVALQSHLDDWEGGVVHMLQTAVTWWDTVQRLFEQDSPVIVPPFPRFPSWCRKFLRKLCGKLLQQHTPSPQPTNYSAHVQNLFASGVLDDADKDKFIGREIEIAASPQENTLSSEDEAA